MGTRRRRALGGGDGTAEFAEPADGAGTANAVADFPGAVTDDVVAPGAYQRRHQAAGTESCLSHGCGSFDDRERRMFKKRQAKPVTCDL